MRDSAFDVGTSGLGWHPDLPDARDYTPEHEGIARLLEQLRRNEPSRQDLDLREYFVGIADQRDQNTSTAHACIALLQYHLRRAYGRIIEPSELFVYKAARRLLDWTGDSGAQLRATLKAIVRFGAPPRHLWPTEPACLDREPDAYAYSFRDDCASLRYVRLDDFRDTPERTLQRVKSFLAAGFPSVFGFSVTTAVTRAEDVAFPKIFDRVRGGQAVVAVGYDDQRRILSDRGALLIRNSWGNDWGCDGYGWLPYAYVRHALAMDFWTIIDEDWLVPGAYARPT